MTTDTRDPVAALNHALTEAGREALGYAPEGGLQGVAQKAMPYLAEEGYFLVNADTLAAALWRRAGSPNDWDANMDHYRADAAAILAALTERSAT